MAQFGSFAHKILEKYYRKEAEFYELSDIYRDELTIIIDADNLTEVMQNL